MKKINGVIVIPVIFLLASCEHRVSMETTVHVDGKLEKVIIVESENDKNISQHVLDSNVVKGWQHEVSLIDTTQSKNKGKVFRHSFRKSFATAEAANQDLSTDNDTLFRVTSTFNKKFRWFYTYIYYSDTYHAINRMQLNTEDYFTPEDYFFIDRLPAEGGEISRADSLYLSELEKKMFDIYGEQAVEEAFFDIGFNLIKTHNLDKKWVDTLAKHKKRIFKKASEQSDTDDDYLLQVMDSLKIPLPYDEVSSEYSNLIRNFEKKIDFITWANEGKYLHQINMPWAVVHSNADSVVGNTAYWAPPRVKFLLKDYTMYAEARSLNYVTLIISIAVLGITVFLFWRKR